MTDLDKANNEIGQLDSLIHYLITQCWRVLPHIEAHAKPEEIAHFKAGLEWAKQSRHREWMVPRSERRVRFTVDEKAPKPYDMPPPPPEANFDSEAVALIRHLKAKGLVLIVFAAQRGKDPESGLSVQFTEDAKDIIKDVPTFLRRLADRMELNLAIRAPGKG